jgi:hypothetical protein
MLPWAVGAFLLYAWVGQIYFARSRQLPDYEKRYSIFTYIMAVLFAALPLTTPDWFWCVPLLPMALYTGTKIIDRHMDRIERSRRTQAGASRHTNVEPR